MIWAPCSPATSCAPSPWTAAASLRVGGRPLPAGPAQVRSGGRELLGIALLEEQAHLRLRHPPAADEPDDPGPLACGRSAVHEPEDHRATAGPAAGVTSGSSGSRSVR